MQHSHLFPGSSGAPLPERFLSRLVGFADLFTCPTWSNVLLLLVLAPGRRTVSTARRILGRERDPNFCNFHRVLNRAAWSSRAAARQLLILLVRALVPTGAPVVIGFDDTIERRWGAKISARSIYRDPVRSSKGGAVNRRDRAVDHAPAAAVDFPAGQSGATCGQWGQRAIGTVNRYFSPRWDHAIGSSPR
jgi:DDE superfamily endonuclease